MYSLEQCLMVLHTARQVAVAVISIARQLLGSALARKLRGIK
jgi:hypothetical protein